MSLLAMLEVKHSAEGLSPEYPDAGDVKTWCQAVRALCWRCVFTGHMTTSCVDTGHDDRVSSRSQDDLNFFSVSDLAVHTKRTFFKETTGVGHTQDSFMVDIHLSLVLKKQWFHTLQNWLWLTGFFYVMITTTVTIFQSSCTSVTLLLHLTFKFFVIFTVMEENKWTSNEIFNNRSYADIFNHWLMKPAVFDFNYSLASITYWLKSFAF